MTTSASDHAPTNTVPGSQALPANGTLVFSTANSNALTVADQDGDQLTTYVWVNDGTLTATAQGAATLQNNGSDEITIKGSAADITATLDGLIYHGSHQADTLAIETDDPWLSTVKSVQITFDGTDHSPNVSVPGTQTLGSSRQVTFTSGSNPLTVSDSDGGTLVVDVGALHGRINATAAGAAKITGNGTDDLTIVGTVADINATLDGLTYRPDTGYHGPDQVYLEAADGDFSIFKYLGVVAPNVDAPPGLTPPLGQIVGTDGKVTFSQANGNAIVVSDGNNDALTVTLTANGTLSAAAAGSATVTAKVVGAQHELIVTGSVADVNATLDGLVYKKPAGHGTDALGVDVSDGTYHTTGDISFSVLDHAPHISAPGGLKIAANGQLTLSSANHNAISVSDADHDTVSVSIFATSEEATMSVTKSGAATVTGNGTDQVTIAGSVADVNATLDGMTWTAAPIAHGEDTLQIQVNDGSKYAYSTIGLTPQKALRSPANLVPAVQTLASNGTVAFNSTNSNAITVRTPDNDQVSTTLHVSWGTLKIGNHGSAGISGNNTGALTLTGTGDEITAALATLTYKAESGYHGPDDIAISTSDGVFTIASDLHLLPASPDHPPTATVPGTQTFAADNSITFSTAKGNAITVADADAGNITVDVYTDHGSADTPTATAVGSVTLTDRFGELELTGSAADINATLNGLRFDQTQAFYQGTSEAVHVIASDGLFITERSIAVAGHGTTWQAPINVVPDVQTVPTNGVVVFNTAHSNAIKVTDTSGLPLTVTLRVGDGTLTATAKGTDTVNGSGSDDLVLKGSASDITLSLATLRYQADSGYHGTDTLNMTTTDGTGQGTILAKIVSTVAFTPVNVDHAPSNTVPVWQAAAGGTETFSQANGNAISVHDSDGGTLTVDLSTSYSSGLNATLSATAAGGATVSGSGSTFLEVTGSVSAINQTLNGLVYHANAAGADMLTMRTSDGTISTESTIGLGKLAPDYAPGFNLPSGQEMSATGSIVFGKAHGNAITVSDKDGDALRVDVEVPDGSLSVTAAGTAHVDQVYAGYIEITGSVADINATLDGMVYQENSNALGTDDTLSLLSVDDGKFNGSPSIHGQVTLSAAPVNGLQITEPGGQIIAANGTIVFSAAEHNALTVAAPSQGSVNLFVEVNAGTLTATAAGLAQVYTYGPGEIDIVGSVADVNATLDGLKYKENAGRHGTDILTLTSGSISSTVVLAGADQPPTISVPDAQMQPSSHKIIFGTGHGNAITIADPDKDTLTARLSVNDGTLTATAAGSAILSGNGSSQLQVVGTPGDITHTLNGLIYQHSAADKFEDNLTVEVVDGGFQIYSEVGLNSAFKDKPPVNALPHGQSVAENSALAFNSGQGNAISVSDPGGQPLTTDLWVGHGALTVTAAGAATISGNGSDSISISGSVADINATLATLVYAPTTGFHGRDTLSVWSNDGALADADTVGITVTAVSNGAIVAAAPAAAPGETPASTDGRDVLHGGAGNDTLDGGLGADTLTGGAGNDTFVFDSKPGRGNVDVITDFAVGDHIELDRAVFSGLTRAGVMSSALFSADGQAHGSNDHILYDPGTGALSYDDDGNGPHVAIRFATLSNHAPLSAADFLVI